MIFDWDHIYILGWYDQNGKPYLTTWDGVLPTVTVYVTGPSSIQHFGPPMWNAIRNWAYGTSYKDMTLHEKKVPGSVKAIAWYIEEGFDRVENPNGIIPRWS